jgi:hypothetical protein
MIHPGFASVKGVYKSHSGDIEVVRPHGRCLERQRTPVIKHSKTSTSQQGFLLSGLVKRCYTTDAGDMNGSPTWTLPETPKTAVEPTCCELQRSIDVFGFCIKVLHVTRR